MTLKGKVNKIRKRLQNGRRVNEEFKKAPIIKEDRMW